MTEFEIGIDLLEIPKGLTLIIFLVEPTSFLKYILKCHITIFRYDWDSFFIENKDMNEMKPGERPDTIHVQNLPTKWFINTQVLKVIIKKCIFFYFSSVHEFATHHNDYFQDKSGIAKDKPSEYVLKKVFTMFGEIRAVDIPMLDPYRYKNYPSGLYDGL